MLYAPAECDHCGVVFGSGAVIAEHPGAPSSYRRAAGPCPQCGWSRLRPRVGVPIPRHSGRGPGPGSPGAHAQQTAIVGVCSSETASTASESSATRPHCSVCWGYWTNPDPIFHLRRHRVIVGSLVFLGGMAALVVGEIAAQAPLAIGVIVSVGGFVAMLAAAGWTLHGPLS